MAKLYKVRKKCMICGSVFYPKYAGSLYCEDCKNRKKPEEVVPKAKPKKAPVKKVAVKPKKAVQKTKTAKPAKKVVKSKKSVKKKVSRK